LGRRRQQDDLSNWADKVRERRIKAKEFEDRKPDPIQPKTETQATYLRALRSEEQIVVLGPAGTGKTFLAGTHAADQLRSRKIRKVVITRPNVPGGRSIGFFPGTLEEKIAPGWSRSPRP
jgi:phosphate starvation-inducible PhoH-like protein